MKNIYEKSLQLHKKYKGKLETKSKVPLNGPDDLALAYTPGVAAPCTEIEKNPSLVNLYTNKNNTVAIITDGSAVLGLGNIGPKAALPVMEGKAILFKKFADIDAIPICLDTQDVTEIVTTICNISSSFGGINLEDISAPRCIQIEEQLKNILDIPVFHDDQHGTAIVTLAALINSLKLVKKNIQNIKMVLIGTGAAGSAVAKLFSKYGVKHIYAYNKDGAVTRDLIESYDFSIQDLLNSNILQSADKNTSLEELCINADIIIGVSIGDIITKKMIQNMEKDPIIFAMANPTPEVNYSDAIKWGAKIVGTGRSDSPNQINNLLAFPGVFRGILDSKYTQITDEMKIQAAIAISSIISDDELSFEYIIPSPFNPKVVEYVANAIKYFK